MAADLAAKLAQQTAQANVPLQSLVRAAAADHGRSDAAWAARVPALLSLARHVGDSRSELGRIRSELGQFQTQLDSASQHIKALQDRSSAMDVELQAKLREEAELSAYLGGIVLSPRVARLILDSPVDSNLEAWVSAVQVLDAQLSASQERISAHASGELPPALKEATAVAEQCKNAAISKIRTHLITLFEPVRASVTTTLQIRQSSVLLPSNQPLYHFLATHAPKAAVEVQRSYVNAVRLYYEAAFRQYTRDLKRIHARWHETVTPLGQFGTPFAKERIESARPDGATPVVLSYMAEDSSFTSSPEALFHNLSMVFIDNACSEYAFLARFFGPGVAGAPPALAQLTLEEQAKFAPHAAVTRETWRQAMEPAIHHWQEFAHVLLGDTSQLLSLLCMVTLADALLEIAKERGCLAPELEHTLMRFIIDGWPRVARALDAEVESVRALSPGRAHRAGIFERLGALASGSTGLAARGDVIPQLRTLISNYVELYNGVAALCTPEHQGMLLGGMSRVRGELIRLRYCPMRQSS
ncbi:Vacuolar protein sorting-associated protein 52 [Malassezia cuniculi]|uniref:Vacuolar protein sorting-associated protein 52 n=1 Tax=Malassezia cuniculi TaxID=948313 RepID=A0AAF0J5R7_9BASI|nr:Vacuolar protein sorting-associated protein 52 [Malassezia cuniculi]